MHLIFIDQRSSGATGAPRTPRTYGECFKKVPLVEKTYRLEISQNVISGIMEIFKKIAMIFKLCLFCVSFWQ